MGKKEGEKELEGEREKREIEIPQSEQSRRPFEEAMRTNKKEL